MKAAKVADPVGEHLGTLEQPLRQFLRPALRTGLHCWWPTGHFLPAALEFADNPECDSDLVREVMTTKVVKLAPKDKVGTAAELFMDRRFKTLPVVNLDNKLKGVVTAFDVIRYSFKKEYPQAILYAERM